MIFRAGLVQAQVFMLEQLTFSVFHRRFASSVLNVGHLSPLQNRNVYRETSNTIIKQN